MGRLKQCELQDTAVYIDHIPNKIEFISSKFKHSQHPKNSAKPGKCSLLQATTGGYGNAVPEQKARPSIRPRRVDAMVRPGFGANVAEAAV